MHPCIIKLAIIQYLTQAFDELGYCAHADILNIVSPKNTGMVASQAAEDAANIMKNHRLVKGKKRYRRPQKCMGACLARNVLSKVHRFKEIEVSAASSKKRKLLPKDAYQAPCRRASMPFGKITSTKQAPDFYSPGAVNICQKYADLPLALEMKKQNKVQLPDSAWLGAIFNCRFKLIFRLPGDSQWYYGGHHFAESSCIVVPAVIGKLPGAELVYFQPDVRHIATTTSPTVLPITSIKDIDCYHYRSRSPMWQHLESGGAADVLPSAVRDFSASGDGPRPILIVLAENAFFKLNITFMRDLAKHIGAPCCAKFGLCETLFVVIQFTKQPISDLDVMKLVCMRKADFRKSQSWLAEVEEIDEAVEVVDKEDEQLVGNLKKEHSRKHDEEEEFTRDVRARCRVARAAAAKAAAKAAPKAKAGAKAAAKPKYPALMPKWPDYDIPVDQARACLPPGGTLWRAEKYNASWQTHYQPFPRCARSVQLYGEAEALRLVLADCWGWHLLCNGMEEKECPIKGLFVVPPAEAASSSS